MEFKHFLEAIERNLAIDTQLVIIGGTPAPLDTALTRTPSTSMPTRSYSNIWSARPKAREEKRIRYEPPTSQPCPLSMRRGYSARCLICKT